MYIDAIFFVTTHILVFLSLIRLYIPVKSMNYVALLSFSHSVDCFHDCLVGRRWIPNPGASFSKPQGGFNADSAFHSSDVDKMGVRNFWELNGKK